jgi:hypothetical protein
VPGRPPASRRPARPAPRKADPSTLLPPTDGQSSNHRCLVPLSPRRPHATKCDTATARWSRSSDTETIARSVQRHPAGHIDTATTLSTGGVVGVAAFRPPLPGKPDARVPSPDLRPSSTRHPRRCRESTKCGWFTRACDELAGRGSRRRSRRQRSPVREALVVKKDIACSEAADAAPRRRRVLRGIAAPHRPWPRLALLIITC